MAEETKNPQRNLPIGILGSLFICTILYIVVSLVLAFFKEIKSVIFSRNVALSLGIPATGIYYAVLLLTGATVAASLRSIGGLLIFALVLNPASAAYQLTYSLKKMFLLSAVFGIISGWIGLLASYFFQRAQRSRYYRDFLTYLRNGHVILAQEKSEKMAG
jgi:manganese/iron transport system permease protein